MMSDIRDMEEIFEDMRSFLGDDWAGDDICHHPRCDEDYVDGQFRCSMYCMGEPAPPIADEYGICTTCHYRVGVACICNVSFADKAATVNIDTHQLRKLHGR